MGKLYPEIDEDLSDWLLGQPMFFVATAPRADDGLVNCSPKGLDSFRVIDPKTVAYLDLTGSGIETIAHLRENGRIVLMFCAFDGPPKIIRLYGTGDVLVAGTPEFEALIGRFAPQPGQRAIIRVSLTRIADSCGYGVPKLEYRNQRETLLKSSVGKGEDGLQEYRREKNATSIDGLPGLL